MSLLSCVLRLPIETSDERLEADGNCQPVPKTTLILDSYRLDVDAAGHWSLRQPPSLPHSPVLRVTVSYSARSSLWQRDNVFWFAGWDRGQRLTHTHSYEQTAQKKNPNQNNLIINTVLSVCKYLSVYVSDLWGCCRGSFQSHIVPLPYWSRAWNFLMFWFFI